MPALIEQAEVSGVTPSTMFAIESSTGDDAWCFTSNAAFALAMAARGYRVMRPPRRWIADTGSGHDLIGKK